MESNRETKSGSQRLNYCYKILGLRNKMIQKFIRFTRNSLCLTFSFLPTLLSRRENVILTYHSISLDGTFCTVKPKDFVSQLEYLKKNYNIVPLVEMLKCLGTRAKHDKRQVSITFDDGYQDFYLNVYPLLRKNNLPATVFVATDYVGKEWPFVENHPKMLTWEQIEEISKCNVEIGAHTITHPNLQVKNLEEAEYEIRKSKEEIEKHISTSAKFFSYPFGRHNPEIVDITKFAGFKGAVGGIGTLQKDSNIFVLNRIQVDSSVSFMLFKARLTKATEMLSLIEEPAKNLVKYFWR
jgi:peptidoglycan/xylan/chitin deacetylase (PgdA/CDA1 family)